MRCSGDCDGTRTSPTVLWQVEERMNPNHPCPAVKRERERERVGEKKNRTWMGTVRCATTQPRASSKLRRPLSL